MVLSVVHLKVLGEQLVVMVQIIVRGFLQKYRDCLGKKLRVDDWGSWVLVSFVGFSWDVVGGDWCEVAD